MNPDTIVLIHGFWVTPRSWGNWWPRYEQQGYCVLTPAYPGFEVEVDALNADPTPGHVGCCSRVALPTSAMSTAASSILSPESPAHHR